MLPRLLVLFLFVCASPAALADEPLDTQSQARSSVREARQRQLLEVAKGREPSSEASAARVLDLDAARTIARQELVVDKLLKNYASPRKAFISSRTKDPQLAAYGEHWRLKIEDVGTQNYPHDQRGSLYGEVMVVAEVDSEGGLVNAEIARSSQNPKLDEAALAIVRRAAPFEPLPTGLRQQYDRLVITRSLKFTREATPALAQ